MTVLPISKRHFNRGIFHTLEIAAFACTAVQLRPSFANRHNSEFKND
jgi:hypothetical protein